MGARQTPGNYVPLDVNYARDKAIRKAGPAAELLFVRSLAYSKGAKTHGFVPEYDLPVVAIGLKAVSRSVAALVREKLWSKTEDGWLILSWNRWNGDTRALHDFLSESGSRGNHLRWHVAAGRNDEGCEHCQASPPDRGGDHLGDIAPRSGSASLREGKGREVKTPSSAAADGPFDEFWTAYPRKVGKDDARRVFRRRIKDTDAAVVIAGAKRLAADPNLPEKQFIPHPATWLQRGGWDDEPLPAPVASGGRTEPERPGFWNEAIA